MSRVVVPLDAADLGLLRSALSGASARTDLDDLRSLFITDIGDGGIAFDWGGVAALGSIDSIQIEVLLRDVGRSLGPGHKKHFAPELARFVALADRIHALRDLAESKI